jgi:hypothetical protein
MLVFEIGAGDGSFIDSLHNRGVEIRGCDPASDGSHPQVEVGTYATCGSGDVQALVLRHVLEHIPEPVQVLRDLGRHFSSANWIYIEVPNLEWILRERAWYDITYEHVNYFTPTLLGDLFGGAAECREVFNSQFIGVFGRLGDVAKNLRLDGNATAQLTGETAELQSAKTSAIGAIRALSADRKMPIGIWGMAGKGAMLLDALQSAGIEVSTTIDINPNKVGKFMPRGVQVQTVDSIRRAKPHLILVSNVAYIDEIRSAGGSDHVYTTIGREGLILA